MVLINKKQKASYTVEATFVMIIVLSVIFALIYLTFYLCDKSKIQDTLDLSAVKISNMIKENSNLETGEVSYEKILDKDWVGNILSDHKAEEKIAVDYIDKILRKGLIIAEIISIDVDIDKTDINISLKVNMNLPLDEIQQYFSKDSRTITFYSTGLVHNPTEFMRLSKASLDTLNKVEGADTVLTKLKDILNKVLSIN